MNNYKKLISTFIFLIAASSYSTTFTMQKLNMAVKLQELQDACALLSAAGQEEQAISASQAKQIKHLTDTAAKLQTELSATKNRLEVFEAEKKRKDQERAALIRENKLYFIKKVLSCRCFLKPHIPMVSKRLDLLDQLTKEMGLSVNFENRSEVDRAIASRTPRKGLAEPLLKAFQRHSPERVRWSKEKRAYIYYRV